MLFSFVQVNAQICPKWEIKTDTFKWDFGEISSQPDSTRVGKGALSPWSIYRTWCTFGVPTKQWVDRRPFSFPDSAERVFEYNDEYSSFVISMYSMNMDNVKIKVGDEIFELINDVHVEDDDGVQLSQLIIPATKANKIEFISETDDWFYGIIRFINVDELGTEISRPQSLYKRGNCTEPSTVSYEIWRNGLPEPKEGRTPNEVEHLIIHHSAGSNAATNYVEVMRNIYVYHTEVNGWDDIGYNYVVAPDGTIFLGRESQGVADHDNILGAHFCGKNTGTMGVCMMGTFTTVAPTNEAINALTDLLAWKAEKEHIYPFGQSIHPSIGGSMLPNIAGHRDGCSTECPGTMTYNMLPTIRDQVLTKLEACGIFVSIDDIGEEQVLIYPNPSNGVFTIEGIKVGTGYTVINTLGQTVLIGSINQKQEQINLTTGLYIFMSDNGYRKKIVVN